MDTTNDTTDTGTVRVPLPTGSCSDWGCEFQGQPPLVIVLDQENDFWTSSTVLSQHQHDTSQMIVQGLELGDTGAVIEDLNAPELMQTLDLTKDQSNRTLILLNNNNTTNTVSDRTTIILTSNRPNFTHNCVIVYTQQQQRHQIFTNPQDRSCTIVQQQQQQQQQQRRHGLYAITHFLTHLRQDVDEEEEGMATTEHIVLGWAEPRIEMPMYKPLGQAKDNLLQQVQTHIAPHAQEVWLYRSDVFETRKEIYANTLVTRQILHILGGMLLVLGGGGLLVLRFVSTLGVDTILIPLMVVLLVLGIILLCCCSKNAIPFHHDPLWRHYQQQQQSSTSSVTGNINNNKDGSIPQYGFPVELREATNAY